MEDLLRRYPELKDNILAAQNVINESARILDSINIESNSFDAERQKKCANGQHEFAILINGAFQGLQWCKYCGAVKYIGGTLYPEYPHFLEKQRKKGE